MVKWLCNKKCIVIFSILMNIVFIKEEINLGQEIPNKWKKHLVLVEFGLKKQEELEKEIHRYSTVQIKKLIEDIKGELIHKPDSGMYIVSFIPSQDYYKLPNFCISSEEDLEELKARIDEDFFNRFSEVWYCKKPIEKGNDVITGRISLDNREWLNSIKHSHSVEQVWNCSHREIESFNKDSDVIYLRASREGWGRHYNIDDLKVPSIEYKDKVIKGFGQTVKNIEENKEKIESFQNYLNQIGIQELCLEYMLSRKGFSFIDWDTSNDRKVIDNIFPVNEKCDFVR